MSKKLIAGAGVVASFAIALAPLATFATDHLHPNAHQDKMSVTIEKVCAFGYTYADTTPVAAGSHTNGTQVSPSEGTGTVNTVTAGKNYGIWKVGSSAQVTTSAGAVSDFQAYDVQHMTSFVDADEDGVYDEGETATYDNGTNTNVLTDTAYGIVDNNIAIQDFAKTKLNVVCNNAKGYTITAESTALSDVANVGHDIPQTASVAAGTSSWSFKYAAVANGNSETAATVTDVRTLTYGSSTAGTWDTATTAKPIITMAKANAATGNAATPKLGDSYEITYGVAISSNQEAGTYEGTITYTLAQTL